MPKWLVYGGLFAGGVAVGVQLSKWYVRDTAIKQGNAAIDKSAGYVFGQNSRFGETAKAFWETLVTDKVG